MIPERLVANFGSLPKEFYLYYAISFLISFYLIYKSNSENKIELFFLSFYLLTGNINRFLTIKIPGFSFFEIQPIRFLFLMCSFFLVRKILFSRTKISFAPNGKIPWFEVMLYAYFVLYAISQIANISVIGFPEIVVNLTDELPFLVVFLSLRLISTKDSSDVIGKSILAGATLSSIVCIIQATFDQFFLRVGTNRLAFGSLLRANGIFFQEHYNSYFLIIAIIWALTTLKNKQLKYILVCLFSIGVFLSFHRMSWLILIAALFIYIVFIEKVVFERLVLAGLSGLALLLIIFIVYNKDIMNSSLVKERLTDDVDGRKGYYTMVFENIHNKPLFGYGGSNNDVYYTYMLQITGSRGRADGSEGGIHSGYFTALFFSGIPVFLSFTLFAVLSALYYLRLCTKNFIFTLAFALAFAFAIGNLTNSLLLSKFVGILYAIHLGIAMRKKLELELDESIS